VLHSTAYNLGLLEGGGSDIPSLLAAVTDGASSQQNSSAPKKRIAALLLAPPEPAIAKVLQRTIRCVALCKHDAAALWPCSAVLQTLKACHIAGMVELFALGCWEIGL
jgi:hypothetical protein